MGVASCGMAMVCVPNWGSLFSWSFCSKVCTPLHHFLGTLKLFGGQSMSGLVLCLDTSCWPVTCIARIFNPQSFLNLASK
jgi:hypothetical protein